MDAIRLYLRDVLRLPMADHDEQAHLHAAWRAGDFTARDQIIHSLLPLVVSMAKEFRGRGLDYLDLIQDGNVGLIRALETWEPGTAKFTTYAWYWIRQSLQRAVQMRGRTIRLPVYIYEQRRKWDRSQWELNELHAAVHRRVASLTDGVSFRGGKAIPLADILGDHRQDNPHREMVRRETIEDVRRKMATMDERLQDILYRRVMGETLEEIAPSYGVTRERVRQLEQRAFKQLAARFGVIPTGTLTQTIDRHAKVALHGYRLSKQHGGYIRISRRDRYLLIEAAPNRSAIKGGIRNPLAWWQYQEFLDRTPLRNVRRVKSYFRILVDTEGQIVTGQSVCA